MNNPTCHSCQATFSERAIFCSNCPTQVRCKECRELIEPNARFCIICGAALLAEKNEQYLAKQNISLGQQPPNTIDYRKSRSGSERLKANFTDETGRNLSGVLGQVLVVGLGLKKKISEEDQSERADTITQRKLPFVSNERAESQTNDKEIENERDVNISSNNTGDVSIENDKDIFLLQKLFRLDNDVYRLVDKRLGGNNSTNDFARRLICIFLYLAELKTKSNVVRESINTVLTDNKVNTGHTRTWLANTPDLVKYSDGYGLSDSGRDFAKLVLTEIRDKGATLKPFTLTSKAKDKGSNKPKPNRDQKNKNSSSINNKPAKINPSSKTRLGPIEVLRKLITENYFDTPKVVSDVISHCKVSSAYTYKATDFSAPLQRLLRSGDLRRKTNSEGQYEYYK